MNYLEEALLKKEQELQSIIIQCEKDLQELPEGNLRISKFGNSLRYYQRSLREDGAMGWEYIKNEDKRIAVAIAQQNYVNKVVRHAKEDLEKIKSFLKEYNESDITNIYMSLNSYRKELVRPIMLSDEEFGRMWEKKMYKTREFKADALEIYTEKGERVLSKSEKILADKFNIRNIPYRYEYPLYLNGIGEIHPDFMLLNKRTRKEYYWEHLGMMDDPEYYTKAISRIELYEKNGIMPGANLIITHETSKRPINMQIVENYIEIYLT